MSSAEHSRPSSGKDQTLSHPDGLYKITISRLTNKIRIGSGLYRPRIRCGPEREMSRSGVQHRIRMSDPDRLEIRISPGIRVNTQWQFWTNNCPESRTSTKTSWDERTTTHTTKEASALKQTDNTSPKNKTETGEPSTSGIKMPRETLLNPGRMEHKAVARHLRRYGTQI